MGWTTYGACPRCGHVWTEHIEGEGCSECVYEIEHEDPDAPSAVCEQQLNAPPVNDLQAILDTTGDGWTPRRRRLSWRRIERLARDANNTVLWVYGDTVSDLPVAERPDALSRVHPNADGTAFRIGEFRDDARRSLLVIEELT